MKMQCQSRCIHLSGEQACCCQQHQLTDLQNIKTTSKKTKWIPNLGYHYNVKDSTILAHDLTRLKIDDTTE